MNNYHLVDKDIIRSVGDGKYHTMAIKFHGTSIWNGIPTRDLVYSTGGDLDTLRELLEIIGEVAYLYIDRIKVYDMVDDMVIEDINYEDYNRAMKVI